MSSEGWMSRMRGFALLAGITAIATNFHPEILLPTSTSDAERRAWLLASALVIAGCFVFFGRLNEYCTSNQWIWILFGVCGVVVLFAGPLSGWLSWQMKLQLLRLKINGVIWAFTLAQLPLLLKISIDLRKSRARQGAPLNLFWIWAVLAVLIGSVFDFTSVFVLKSLTWKSLAASSENVPTWPLVLQWFVAGLVAFLFVRSAHSRGRLRVRPPGLIMASLGVGVSMVAGMWIASSSPSELKSLPILFALFSLAEITKDIVAILVAAQFLLVVGTLRMLFSLGQSYEEDEILEAAKAASRRKADSSRQVATEAKEPLAPPPLVQTFDAPRSTVQTQSESEAQTSSHPQSSIAVLRERVAAKPDNAVYHESLHRALRADDSQKQAMIEHARDYLAVLVRQSRGHQSYTLLRTCLASEEAFTPPADLVLFLARQAFAHKDPKTALLAMRHFDRSHPGHPGIPDVYFLSARALRDLKRYQDAYKLVETLLTRFPESAVARDARTLHQALRAHIQASQ